VRDNLGIFLGNPVCPALLGKPLAQEGGTGMQKADLVVEGRTASTWLARA
jgi:hypothetical protein